MKFIKLFLLFLNLKLEKDEQEEDVYEAKLQCGICQDILYKALTLVPVSLKLL